MDHARFHATPDRSPWTAALIAGGAAALLALQRGLDLPLTIHDLQALTTGVPLARLLDRAVGAIGSVILLRAVLSGAVLTTSVMVAIAVWRARTRTALGAGSRGCTVAAGLAGASVACGLFAIKGATSPGSLLVAALSAALLLLAWSLLGRGAALLITIAWCGLGLLDPGLLPVPLGIAGGVLLLRNRLDPTAGAAVGLLAAALVSFLLRGPSVLEWPATWLLLGGAVAVAIATQHSRLAWASSILLTVIAAGGALRFGWQPARAVPLRAAGLTLREQFPAATGVIAGVGVAPGALRLALLGTGLEVVPSARDDREPLGEVSLATRPFDRTERQRLNRAIGTRVLERYGVIESRAASVRWALHRPLRIESPNAIDRPNLAIVAIDTLRADRLPLYGYQRDTAPQLTRWATRATLYERAYSSAPETFPSFASLMTGRLPAAHGGRDNAGFFAPGNWPLARVLAAAGYETAAFTSSVVTRGSLRGLDDGFALYDDRGDREEPQRPGNISRLSTSLVPEVDRWLDAHRGAGQPWFLWVHCIDPHGPYNPLPGFAGTFKTGRQQLLTRPQIPDLQFDGSLDYYRYFDAYDDEIRQFDSQIGPLLERLSAPPAAGERETIVIFTADHGEAFGEHGEYFHHGFSLHREEIHVPLMTRGLTADAGRIATPVSLLDVLPTVLERLRIDTDLPLDGMPLPQRVATETPVISGNLPGEVAVITRNRKLYVNVRRADRGSSAAVYDPLADPLERNPLPERGEELEPLARGYVANDPLGSGAELLLQEQWNAQSPEEIERLRSLGYVAPGSEARTTEQP